MGLGNDQYFNTTGQPEPQPNISQYASYLLSEWVAISEYGKLVRRNMIATPNSRNAGLAEYSDKDELFEYVAALTQMWVQLAPKIDGRTEPGMKAFAEEFMTFRDLAYAPGKLLEKENADKIFKLEENIRKGLEKLGVTKFQ